jgi:pimeloyl-ACP methyl ester carboxylesterase
VQAYFFNGSAGQLFGAFHANEAPLEKPVALVLCPPFGEEGVIAYGALRQLAVMAAKRGFSVLRFEYFGTGDSAGASEDFSLSQAGADTHRAVEEARELTGLSRVALVGLRLGAVPALAVAERDERVVATVLWDPVVDGRAYLAELLGDPAKLSPVADGSEMTPGIDTVGVDGFPLTPALHGEIEAIRLVKGPWSDRYAKILVHSGDANVSDLQGTMQFADVAVEHGDALWRDSPGVDTPPPPTGAMLKIIDAIEGLDV